MVLNYTQTASSMHPIHLSPNARFNSVAIWQLHLTKWRHMPITHPPSPVKTKSVLQSAICQLLITPTQILTHSSTTALYILNTDKGPDILPDTLLAESLLCRWIDR